jgi:hypothetical protein
MSAKPPEWLRYLGLSVLAAGVLLAGCFFSARFVAEPVGVSLPAAIASTEAGASLRTEPAIQSQPLAAEPTGPSQTDTDAVAALVKLAASDPPHALSEALRETDLERRQRLIMAVLKAWAAVEPDAAARAALVWPANDRVEPVAAVFAGVAQRPEDALRLGTFFCREDPAWAPEHGRALIAELTQAGHFSAAVSFALTGGAEVEGEERCKWLTAAFAGWAQREPQLAALAATSDLPESGMQAEALLAVVSRWRRLNPGGPEKFLTQLPPGPERAALTAALAMTATH